MNKIISRRGCRSFFLSALLLFFYLTSQFTVLSAPVDAIVARVDGHPILRSDVQDAMFDQEIPRSPSAGNFLHEDHLRRALTQVVDQTLLVQQARRENLDTDSVQLARTIEQMIEALELDLKNQGDSMREFLRRHRLSADELRERLMRRERERMLATEVVARRVQVGRAAVEAFIEQREAQGEPVQMVRALHALFPFPAGAGEDAKEENYQRALAFARQVGRTPDRFAELTEAYELKDGGDLGWLDPATLQPPLAEALETLKSGNAAPPIATERGHHVLVLLGRRQPRDLLFTESFEKERTALLEKLRAETPIEIY